MRRVVSTMCWKRLRLQRVIGVVSSQRSSERPGRKAWVLVALYLRSMICGWAVLWTTASDKPTPRRKAISSSRSNPQEACLESQLIPCTFPGMTSSRATHSSLDQDYLLKLKSLTVSLHVLSLRRKVISTKVSWSETKYPSKSFSRCKRNVALSSNKNRSKRRTFWRPTLAS